MSEEKCVRCGNEDEDTRTLWMSCFYAMEELGIPFEQIKPKVDYPSCFYTLRVCKECRAAWMQAIAEWFWRPEPAKESPGTGIFVRKLGTTIEISEEQWKQENPGREPVRFRP